MKQLASHKHCVCYILIVTPGKNRNAPRAARLACMKDRQGVISGRACDYPADVRRQRGHL